MTISLNDNHPNPRLVPSPSAGTFEMRRLGPRDLAGVAAFYLSLDEAERVNRFHTPIDDLGILSYLNRIDFAKSMLIGAVDWATATLIGLVEVHRPDENAPAEMALCVAPGSRSALAASQLMDQAMDAAAMLGADTMVADFNSEDRMTKRVMTEFGAKVDLVNCQATLTWSNEQAVERAA